MTEPMSQSDLDALFGDILAGTDDTEEAAEEKSKKKIEAKPIEEVGGAETMTQEQIDELLKQMLEG